MTGPPALRVLGYFTLSASLVNTGELPDTLVKKLRRHPQLPVTLLGRQASPSQAGAVNRRIRPLFMALAPDLA